MVRGPARLLVALLASSALLHQGAEAADPGVVVETRLALDPRAASGEDDPKPSLSGDLVRLEEDLWEKECPLTETELGVAEILGFVAKPLIRFIADRIGSSLQEKLKGYTASYSASDFAALYESVDPLELGVSCFQLTRVERAKNAEPKTGRVTLDVVGKFELIGGTALAVRPLRVYFAKAAAKSADGSYGLSVGLSGDAFWKEGRGGKKAEKVIAVENFVSVDVGPEARREFGDGNVYYVRFRPGPPSKGFKTAPAVPQPLPPWSTDGSSVLSLTLSVAEVGRPDFILENLAKLFEAKKDDLVKLLEAAADKALEGKGTD
jgi:hypothetical protein